MAFNQDSGRGVGAAGLPGSGPEWQKGHNDWVAEKLKVGPLGPGPKPLPPGDSGLTPVGSIAVLCLLAAAWLIAWPWCLRAGYDIRIAQSFISPKLDFQSAHILAYGALGLAMFTVCFLLAKYLPWISLVVAAIGLFVHFQT